MACGRPSAGQRRGELGAQVRGDGVDPGVHGLVGQPQRGQARGRGHRVPGQRARLVDGADRGQLGHDVAAAADRGDLTTFAVPESLAVD